MTGIKVVDASAVAAILFAEPDGAHVVTEIGPARLVAPLLLGFELANICWKKIRRAPDQEGDLLSLFAERRRLDIAEYAVDHDRSVALASRLGLTAYDASYLWLARDLNIPLVTLDARLLRAMAA